MPFIKCRLLWHETLIAYYLPFLVSTQVSDYQLGLVIKHRIPVAFYSCKLTSAWQNYITMEKEFLSIIETFTVFHTMLFGCHVFLIATLLSILFLPTWVMHWCFSLFGRIPSSLPLYSRILKHTRSCLSKASSSWGADYGFHIWSFTMFSARAHV